MTWPTLAARAAGLSTRLCDDAALAAFDAAPDAAALGAALVRAGYLAPPALVAAPALAAAVEAAAARRAADDLAILARWRRPGDDAAVAALAADDPLAAITLDLDRRTLRGLARGLAAGAPVARRLAGAVPTPALPARALDALAAAPGLAELAALLARRDHPLAAAMVPPPRPHPRAGVIATAAGAAPRTRAAARTALGAAPAAGPAMELYELELALTHAFAARAVAACRRGGAALATYVGQVVDAENAAAALLIGARGDDLDPERAFVAGPRGHVRLDRAAWQAAVDEPARARDRLAAAFAGAALAKVLLAGELAHLEDAALDDQLAAQAALRRTEPLGLAPVLHMLLRRRAEARRVRRAAWRLALGGGRAATRPAPFAAPARATPGGPS